MSKTPAAPSVPSPTIPPATQSGTLSDTGEIRVHDRPNFTRHEVDETASQFGLTKLTINDTDPLGACIMSCPVPIITPLRTGVFPRALLFFAMSRMYRADQSFHFWAIKHDPLPCTIRFYLKYGKSPLSGISTDMAGVGETAPYAEWNTIDTPHYTLTVPGKYTGTALYSHSYGIAPDTLIDRSYASLYMTIVRPYTPGTIFPTAFDVFVSGSFQNVELNLLADARTSDPSQLSMYYP